MIIIKVNVQKVRKLNLKFYIMVNLVKNVKIMRSLLFSVLFFMVMH